MRRSQCARVLPAPGNNLNKRPVCVLDHKHTGCNYITACKRTISLRGQLFSSPAVIISWLYVIAFIFFKQFAQHLASSTEAKYGRSWDYYFDALISRSWVCFLIIRSSVIWRWLDNQPAVIKKKEVVPSIISQSVSVSNDTPACIDDILTTVASDLNKKRKWC